MRNRVDLIGHLGADPEVRTFASGDKVCNLRLATSERWRDKHSGEIREKTEWHSVAVFGPLADIAARARKGGRIAVTGKLSTRKWQDQSGADRYTTEVVLRGYDAEFLFLDRAPEGAGARDGRSAGDAPPPARSALEDDEIPF